MSILGPIGKPTSDIGVSGPAHARAGWGFAGIEPSLGEVMSDPLVHLMMLSDGVGPDALAAVVADARAGLRRLVCRAAAA